MDNESSGGYSEAKPAMHSSDVEAYVLIQTATES